MRRYKVLILSIFVLLLLAACGGEDEGKSKDTTKNEDKTNEIEKVETEVANAEVSEEEAEETEGTEEEKTEPEEEEVYLELLEKVEQFGGEELSNELPDDVNYVNMVLENDGATYVYSNIGNLVAGDVTFWIVKDNKLIGTKTNNIAAEIKRGEKHEDAWNFEGTSFWYEGIDFDLVDNYQNAIMAQRIYLITLNENLEYKVKQIRDKTEENLTNLIPQNVTKEIGGTESLFVKECTEEKCNILNTNLEVVYTYDKSKIDNGLETLLLDEKNSLLYLEDLTAYDLKQNDFVWDETGAKKEFLHFPTDYDKSYVVDDGTYGMYTLELTDSNSGYLSFYSLDEHRNMDAIDLYSNLEIEAAFLAVNDTEVNVYTVVVYKGKPTVQLYIYPRVDL